MRVSSRSRKTATVVVASRSDDPRTRGDQRVSRRARRRTRRRVPLRPRFGIVRARTAPPDSTFGPATVRNVQAADWTGSSLTLRGGAKTSNGQLGGAARQPPDRSDLRDRRRQRSRLPLPCSAGFHFLWNIGNESSATEYFFASLNCASGRVAARRHQVGRRRAPRAVRFVRHHREPVGQRRLGRRRSGGHGVALHRRHPGRRRATSASRRPTSSTSPSTRSAARRGPTRCSRERSRPSACTTARSPAPRSPRCRPRTPGRTPRAAGAGAGDPRRSRLDRPRRPAPTSTCRPRPAGSRGPRATPQVVAPTAR